MSPRAVLVDLDGTLLDTAPELAAAANRMLGELGLPARSVEEIASYIGKGVPTLVRRALGDGQARLQEALPIFERYYEEASGRQSVAYPGAREGIARLRAAGLALACVTNKPERFTLPLLERMGLAPYVDAVVCADRLARTKPDPLPFLHACKLLEVKPREALVIGDSANDVQAARAADIPVVCVAYGYTEGRAVDSLGADLVIADLPALGKLLGREPSAFDKHR